MLIERDGKYYQMFLLEGGGGAWAKSLNKLEYLTLKREERLEQERKDNIRERASKLFDNLEQRRTEQRKKNLASFLDILEKDHGLRIDEDMNVWRRKKK